MVRNDVWHYFNLLKFTSHLFYDLAWAYPGESFFLELVLHWLPVAYWAPTDLGSSSFSVQPFCLFILFMGFSRQEYWSGLSFPSPVDHILSELSTMTRPAGMALHGMAHSFIELDKAVVHVITLVSFLWWCPFRYRGLECKSRMSRNTWSNRQIKPLSTEWSRAKANQNDHMDHSLVWLSETEPCHIGPPKMDRSW